MQIQTKNLDGYGHDPIPWSRALEQLEAPPATTDPQAPDHTTYWLTTVRPDGQPHATGVGALWRDGKFYFTSGAGTQKSRNLAVDPHCVISVALPGLDLVVEGTVAKVTDAATLEAWPRSIGARGGRRASRMAPSPRSSARRAPDRRHGTATRWRHAPRSGWRRPSPGARRAGASTD